MKIQLLKIASASFIAAALFSCSSSKVASNMNETKSVARVSYKSAPMIDAQSLENYKTQAQSNYVPTVDLSEQKTANAVEPTAVASASEKVVVAERKNLEVKNSLTKAEKAELKKAIKEVIKSKSLNKIQKDSEANDAKGSDNKIILLILSILSVLLVANVISIHRWYMFFKGHKPSLTVALLDLFLGLITLGIVSWIWGIIDIIRIAIGTLSI